MVSYLIQPGDLPVTAADLRVPSRDLVAGLPAPTATFQLHVPGRANLSFCASVSLYRNCSRNLPPQVLGGSRMVSFSMSLLPLPAGLVPLFTRPVGPSAESADLAALMLALGLAMGRGCRPGLEQPGPAMAQPLAPSPRPPWEHPGPARCEFWQLPDQNGFGFEKQNRCDLCKLGSWE